MRTTLLTITTRWPAEQTGPKSFVIDLPLGGTGPTVINEEFTRGYPDLSDRDIEAMTISALTAIAILKGQ